jgi:hypothetical protein
MGQHELNFSGSRWVQIFNTVKNTWIPKIQRICSLAEKNVCFSSRTLLYIVNFSYVLRKGGAFTMALGSTQALVKMSIKNISWG